MTVKTAFVVLAALTSAAAVGCASGSSDNSGQNPDSDQTKASLHRAKGCDDLLGDLKADAKWKLNHSIDLQIQNIKACQAHYPDAQCASWGYYGGARHSVAVDDSAGSSFGEATSAPTPTAGGTAPPAASGAGDSATDSKSASSFSQTNTQVKGVDEADIVKNDGANIYVLHGNAFKVIHAFPATEMKESGSIAIDGTPTEMFVADGKVVVYSQVNGADVLKAAGITARSQYQDYGWGYAFASGGAEPPNATDSANVAPSPGGTTPAQPQVYVPLTKVTVLTLNGDTPVVTRESWFEGSYLDSRRVGSSVRTVYQGNAYGPALKYNIYDGAVPPVSAGDPGCAKDVPCTTTPAPAPTNPYPQTGTDSIAALEKLRAENTGIIDASVINDWLPYTFVRANGGVSAATTACADFYVPTVGSTESGITEVSTIDLNDPSGAPRETAILGRADTVYGNADSLYVAAHAYVEPPFVWYDTYGGDVAVSTPPSSGTGGATGSADGGTASPVTDPPAPTPKPVGGIGTESLHPRTAPNGTTPAILSWSSDNTHVHKFEFASDPKFGNYVASGTVRGAVKDQFSLDEKDGFLRIATTEYRNYYTSDGVWAQADSAPVAKGGAVPARPQQVNHVFVLGQTGTYLGQQGDAGDLAPNERIYSVRFVDNRGYVVTYRQVDPLFVLDLSTPQKPTVVGELTIPGFSEYMHPLDTNHLLTIGRNDQSQLALSIFDVSNPAAPNRTFNLAYTGGDYASSSAEYDHKAFTYFADKGLLAIPFYSYGYAKSDSYGMHSSLEIFKIDVNAGITHLGDVDGTALVSQYKNGYCGGYYSPEVRRGVFLDTAVYAISYGGIAAKDVNNLGAAPTTFPLPYPQANDYYGGAIAACAPVSDAGGDPEPKK